MELDKLKKLKLPCWHCGIPAKQFCAKCKMARYCSVECQRENWKSSHKKECGTIPMPVLAKVQIADIPGKGKGMRAGEDIKNHTMFFVEPPVCVLAKEDGSTYVLHALKLLSKNKVSPSSDAIRIKTQQLIRGFFPTDPSHPAIDHLWNLTYEARKDIIKAKWRPEDYNSLQEMLKTHPAILKLTMAKLRLNSFIGHVSMIESFCLFEKGCLVNHSCRPNTRYRVDNGNFTLISLRDIAKGEEITMSYNDKLWTDMPYIERTHSIMLSYLFECKCEKCEEEKLITPPFESPEYMTVKLGDEPDSPYVQVNVGRIFAYSSSASGSTSNSSSSTKTSTKTST